MRTFTRFTIIALAALAASGASAAQASADIRFVCAEAGACQYGSIQAAVNDATGADTIRVREGTYNEAVTIPDGKSGLTLSGAQAGVAGDVESARPADGHESVLSGGAARIALRVNSSSVTVDGFVVRDSEEGVRTDPATSGLRVVNTVFVANDNSIVPDSIGDLETVIEHNAFLETPLDRGPAPGYAIIAKRSRGRLLVSENRIGAGRLVGIFGLQSREVSVRGNRGNDGDFLAVLGNVQHGVIEDNVVSEGGLALLTGTGDVAVRSNTVTGGGRFGVALTREFGPSVQTTIEGNDFSGSTARDAIIADAGVADTVVAHYNRFAPDTRGVLAGDDSRVDARYNWWGCNEGPSAPKCARLDEAGSATVTRSPWLTLSIETDTDRIVNASGGTTGFRTSLLRDSAGTVHQPASFPEVPFGVNWAGSGAEVQAFRHLTGGVAGGTLIARGAQGVDLQAFADNATAVTHVDFGPASEPAPQGAPGAVAGPTRTVAAASSCKASARALSCVLTGKSLRVSRGRGVKATLYRSGHRIASGRVRVARGKVQLRVGRRVAAGRYDLVLTRAGRRLARQAVVVTA